MENFWQIERSQILQLYRHLRSLVWVCVLFTQVSDCQCILFDYTESWKSFEWVEIIWHNLPSLNVKIKEKQKLLGGFVHICKLAIVLDIEYFIDIL